MNFFDGKRVLVIGGLGFIGSNLSMHLVQLGAKVLIVDSLIPDYGGNLFNIEPVKDKVQLNIADVRDQSGINYLVQGHDIIFNLAGQVSHIDSMRDPFTDLDINVESQLHILEACRKNNPDVKIVYAGTRQLYGETQYSPVDENHPLIPTDINGVNKMAGERFHLLYYKVYGLRTVSLRLTNTYGPRQLMKNNKQGFIYWFIRLALDNQEIPIYGDGLQERDLNYVDDVVDAFLLAAANEKSNGEVFNVGSGQSISLLDLTELILKISESGSYRLIPFPDDRKAIDIGSYCADIRKIQSVLGWKPKVSLEEGIRRTVDYFRLHKAYYW